MIELVKNTKNINLNQASLKGEDGGYYIPQVDAEGNITWVPSEEGMAAVDAANIKGPQGESGVYVGTAAPENGVKVWINPDGPGTDLSNYYTKAQTETLVEEAVAGVDIPDLSGYYTKTETENAIDKAIGEIEGPDLSVYYTKTETDKAIEDAVAGVEIPDVSGYALKTEVPTKVSQLTNDSEYQTATQVTAAINSALEAIGVAEDGEY